MRDRDPVARAVAQFVVASLLVLAVVGVGGVLVLRRVGTDEAMRQAEDTAVVAARAVQDRLTDRMVDSGSFVDLQPLDALVTAGVLQDPIDTVSLRTADGRMVYSNEPELIGTHAALSESETAILQGRETTVSEVASSEDPFLEVSIPISTPNDRALLFQARLRFDSVAASGRQLWTAFIPVLAVTLVALAALEIPLAVRLARRIRDSQREREQLLQHAIEASDIERRRIAGELHDGLGQQLVGLSMTLSAEADAIEPGDAAAAGRLRDAADRTRQQMRSLRSALMGIYPPTLERTGLASALEDLGATLRAQGLEVTVQVDLPDGADLPASVDALLFKGAREATRNVAAHAHAQHADIVVTIRGRRVVLQVTDDGVGFEPDRSAQAADGHLGLLMLDDLARQAGGSLTVDPGEQGGTTLRLEAPLEGRR
jgi:two-component system, NarL family, sensor kinase